MSFRTRLLAFLLAAFVGLQLLSAVAVYGVARDSLIKRGKDQLEAAAGNFSQQVGLLSTQVSGEARALAFDYGLRAAIAQQDAETTLSALQNHGSRLGAARVILVGLDNMVMIDTVDKDAAGTPFAFPDLLEEDTDSTSAPAVVTLDNHAYWIVATPVLAPVPIAHIVAAVPLDDAFLEKLRRMSSVPISIALLTSDASRTWNLAGRSGGHLLALSTLITATAADEPRVSSDRGQEFLTLAAPLQTPPRHPPINVVLSYSIDDAIAEYRPLFGAMLLVLIGAAAAAVGGAWLIAKGVSRPVEALAVAARQIEGGDYAPVVNVPRGGELGQLAAALSAMALAIQSRDRRLTENVAELESRVELRTEELRVARDAAEAASRSKGDFLAAMSHEIRTPMSGLLGMADLLLTTNLDDRQKRYAVAANHAGHHLLSIINNILDFSKIEAGRLELAPEYASIADVVEDAVALLAESAQRKGLGLTVDLPAGRRLMAEVDTTRLKQVLLNLVNNAIKFTEAGEISVSVRVAAETPDLLTLAFAVRDTGIGIPREVQERIFEQFGQADGLTSRRYGGSGLGLTICRQIVGLMGGRIWLESEAGAGSIFRFELPCPRMQDDDAADGANPSPATAARESSPAGPAAAPELSGKRVLLVDDDQLSRVAIGEMLCALGIEIEEATDGHQALQALEIGSFDLVLMDCNMPGMTGFEATARIRAREAPRDKRTVVIAITANAVLGSREDCIARGFDDYLGKPFRLRELKGALERWLPRA